MTERAQEPIQEEDNDKKEKAEREQKAAQLVGQHVVLTGFSNRNYLREKLVVGNTGVIKKARYSEYREKPWVQIKWDGFDELCTLEGFNDKYYYKHLTPEEIQDAKQRVCSLCGGKGGYTALDSATGIVSEFYTKKDAELRSMTKKPFFSGAKPPHVRKKDWVGWHSCPRCNNVPHPRACPHCFHITIDPAIEYMCSAERFKLRAIGGGFPLTGREILWTQKGFFVRQKGVPLKFKCPVCDDKRQLTPEELAKCNEQSRCTTCDGFGVLGPWSPGLLETDEVKYYGVAPKERVCHVCKGRGRVADEDQVKKTIAQEQRKVFVEKVQAVFDKVTKSKGGGPLPMYDLVFAMELAANRKLFPFHAKSSKLELTNKKGTMIHVDLMPLDGSAPPRDSTWSNFVLDTYKDFGVKYETIHMIAESILLIEHSFSYKGGAKKNCEERLESIKGGDILDFDSFLEVVDYWVCYLYMFHVPNTQMIVATICVCCQGQTLQDSCGQLC